MRICQVVHGFPPVERTGVETYTEGLSRALARAGHRVEVFVPRREPALAHLSVRREERDGYAITWVTNNVEPKSPREALLVPGLGDVFRAFLERERPEVVHFQHLIKLGIGLVGIARERGVPTVYTAHDYYPICHRYTLLRPDLSRCEARGDAAACARCDTALGHLNAQPGLGDYQAGVLRDQLSDAAWNELQRILSPPDGGAPAAAERAELDRLRAEAYAELDLVLSPSRCLMDELVRGGLDARRVAFQPYGFDNADLTGLPRVRSDPSRPVRFGYIGSLAKHKGVHVLVEAFGRLERPGGAELTVHGGSSDAVHVERLQRRCAEVGARFAGAYERARLPAMLADIDAVVVPSIWLENYPLVIHEAFSAGRPVLASRLGAMPESVHDGVDGLLFAPGDAADLARALRRCIDEPDLLATLARGIGPEKTMEQEARELGEHYARLSGARRAVETDGLPASLAPALARHQELAALPARELLERVLTGLDGLRAGWAEALGGADAAALLARGLAGGSEAQDRLREARNEIAWLRGRNDEFEQQWSELERLAGDIDQLLGEPRDALDAARAGAARAEARADELEERLGEAEERLAEAGSYIRRKEREHLDAEAQWRHVADYARRKEDELRWAQEAEREGKESSRSIAQVGLAVIRAQEGLLNRALRPLLERLHRSLAPDAKLELPAAGAQFAELLRAAEQLQASLGAAADELDWLRGKVRDVEARAQGAERELAERRARMDGLVREVRRHPLLARLLAMTSIGRSLASWERGAKPEEERA